MLENTLMRRKPFSLWSVFITACFLLLSRPAVVRAQSALQLSPTSLEFEMSPGAQSVGKVELFNPSLTTLQEGTVVVLDLTVRDDEEGTYAFITDPHSRYSISQWISVTPAEFSLQPQEAQKVEISLNVPREAEAGGHYGLILAMPEGFDAEGEGIRFATTGGLGMVLLGTLPGEISYEGTLLEFLPVQDSIRLPITGQMVSLPFVDLGPVEYVVRFSNQGTVHYSPYGYVEIYDWFGGKVDQIEIAPQRVFPDKVRRIKTVWKRLFLIGKYRAVAHLYYGQAGYEKEAVAEIYFWAFPLRAALIIVLFILLIWAVWALKKKLASEEEGKGDSFGSQEVSETPVISG